MSCLVSLMNTWSSAQASAAITMAQQRLNLSARGYHRVLRVARTIADLADSTDITSAHVSGGSAIAVSKLL